MSRQLDLAKKTNEAQDNRRLKYSIFYELLLILSKYLWKGTIEYGEDETGTTIARFGGEHVNFIIMSMLNHQFSFLIQEEKPLYRIEISMTVAS